MKLFVMLFSPSSSAKCFDTPSVYADTLVFHTLIEQNAKYTCL